MNMRRIVVLLLAAVAAGGVALLVRGMLGGGTTAADARTQPAPVALSDVLVAADNLQPGRSLTVDQVRWEKWPTSSTDPGFILKTGSMTAAQAVAGTVVRAPMVPGEPITYAKIVKSGAAGFMAATLTPGMRAVSISVSVASVAGGFILPNDRVDIILTQNPTDGSKRATAHIVLTDVRVLAIDQAVDTKNQKAISDVKTATLELTPDQAQTVALAQASGTLSLALRALGDNSAVRRAALHRRGFETGGSEYAAAGAPVTVIRYGIEARKSGSGGN